MTHQFDQFLRFVRHSVFVKLSIAAFAAAGAILILAVVIVKCHWLTESEIKSIGAIFTGIGLTVGATWAVLTYLNNKRLEFQRYFIERQVEIALITANTVGNLVGCDEKEWNETRGRFWELYWGRLVLFEDGGVIAAMVALGEKLKTTQVEDRSNLANEVYKVSLQLRRFLEEKNKAYWGLPFDEPPEQRPEHL